MCPWTRVGYVRLPEVYWELNTLFAVQPFGNRITLLLNTDDPISYTAYDEFLTWLEEMILPRFLHNIG